MGARPTFSDAERRARLVARHHLARTARDVETAVRAVAAQHSSDPLTPFLAAWVRVPGFAVADLERAMYEERALWRMHAMRRTLFVVPTEDAPVFGGAASLDVAATERRRMIGWLEAALSKKAAAAWLDDAEAKIEAVLSEAGEATTAELTARLPELALTITLGSGKWTQQASAMPRVLYLMGMEGRVARGRPLGTWRASQYRWMSAATFSGRAGAYGAVGSPPAAAEAEAALLERYLATHAPATTTDIRWWTGWKVSQTKRALAAVGAVPVGLEGGGEGWILPGDEGGELGGDGVEAQVALLPGLDSSPMGWKERGWFLSDEVARATFDTNGNAGPAVWVGGRAVGGWAQEPSGEVVFRLLEDVGAERERRVAEEAAALGAWLGGAQPTRARFPSPLEKELGGRAPKVASAEEGEDG